MNINWVDVIILALLALSIIRGLMRGLIRSVFDILALIAAIYLAFYWYRDAAVIINGYVKLPPNVLFTASYIAVWIAVFAATTVIGTVIHKLIGKGILGPLNMLGGGLIGAAKGLLIVWILLEILNFVPLTGDIEKTMKGSESLKVLKPLIFQMNSTVSEYMPKNIPSQQNIPRYEIKPQPKPAAKKGISK